MYITVNLQVNNSKFGEYSYQVTNEQFGKLKIGSQVVVNMRNQLKIGTVCKLGMEAKFNFELKPIIAVYKYDPLNKYQAAVANDIYKNSMASALEIQSLFTDRIADSKIDVEYYEGDKLVGSFRKTKNKSDLVSGNYEQRCIVDFKPKNNQYIYLRANSNYCGKLTEKQQLVFEYVSDNGIVSATKILHEVGASRYVINSLIEKQALKKEMQTKQFETLFDLKWQQINNLTAIQQLAYDSLKPGCNLLHGVSGSGKTEIYIEVIKELLAKQQQVLVVVPSVMLAVQVVGKMQKMWREQVIIYHSQLTDSEKYSYKQQIKTGSKNLVIGTFESLFLPFEKLSYVIFDEAHSSNYKVGKKININKQVIVDSLLQQGLDVLLGTATPSIVDYAKTTYNRTNLVTISNRYEDANLPQIRFVKPTAEIISDKLIEFITINKTRAKPSIIFFNKSGYASQVLCKDCFNLYTCPNCSKPLTYYAKTNKLCCKYDGFSKKFIVKCEKCGSQNLKYTGIGIENFQQQLQTKFKNLVIKLVDGQMKAAELHQVMAEFGSGQIDVLIGTQTIAYGIDFLNSDNIFITNIDSLLTIGEVNSHEKTFNLLEQVVGRVGRGSKYSQGIIETNFESHFVMKAVATHNYQDYFKCEMKLRKSSHNPPFFRICKVELLADNRQKLTNISNLFKSQIEKSGLKCSDLITPFIDYRFGYHRLYFLIIYKHEDVYVNLKKRLNLLKVNNIDYNIDINNNEIGV